MPNKRLKIENLENLQELNAEEFSSIQGGLTKETSIIGFDVDFNFNVDFNVGVDIELEVDPDVNLLYDDSICIDEDQPIYIYSPWNPCFNQEIAFVCVYREEDTRLVIG